MLLHAQQQKQWMTGTIAFVFCYMIEMIDRKIDYESEVQQKSVCSNQGCDV